MKFDVQKNLAASVLGVSKKRIKINLERLEELDINIDDFKHSITKNDIRSFIKKEVIRMLPKRGISRGRARKIQAQKRKGRRKGYGSRKGTENARLSKKERWMNKIRIQRAFLKNLRDTDLIRKRDYRTLYAKAKGGFFRSKRHVKLYIEEHNIIGKNGNS